MSEMISGRFNKTMCLTYIHLHWYIRRNSTASWWT